jgi:hypothetical protein
MSAATSCTVRPDYIRALAERVERGEATPEDRRVLEAIAAALDGEIYSEERIAEFARAAEMNDAELAESRAKWSV